MDQHLCRIGVRIDPTGYLYRGHLQLTMHPLAGFRSLHSRTRIQREMKWEGKGREIAPWLWGEVDTLFRNIHHDNDDNFLFNSCTWNSDNDSSKCPRTERSRRFPKLFHSRSVDKWPKSDIVELRPEYHNTPTVYVGECWIRCHFGFSN